MSASSARAVIVIDEDIATFKGISRVARQSGFETKSFPDYTSFAQWFNALATEGAATPFALCLVIDARSLVSDMDWQANSHIQAFPKICIGTPAAMSVMGQQLDAFQGEFVRKPFTLASIQSQIEAAFDQYASMVSAESENRTLLEMFSLLTLREREVAALVGFGNSNLEIAEALGITLKTVKAHRAKVMDKTQSSTIADFVRKFERYRQAIPKREGKVTARTVRNKESI